MAQLQVATHSRPAQVQVTILHTQVVASIRILLNRERRGQSLVQDSQLRNDQLNLTCRQISVLA